MIVKQKLEDLHLTDEEILKAFECCCGDGVNGTHCKDCPAEKYNFDWCSDEVSRKMVAYTKRLQAENAALRERLEKAVEFPYHLRDEVFAIVEVEPSYKIFRGEVISLTIDSQMTIWVLVKYDNGLRFSHSIPDPNLHKTPEAAEARLKELQGEKDD